jgi:hypothetical protein
MRKVVTPATIRGEDMYFTDISKDEIYFDDQLLRCWRIAHF